MRPVVLALAFALAACSNVVVGPEAAAPEGDAATVVHVSDGDSLIVDRGGFEDKVRLIGINAPERDECFGDASRARLESLVLGELVTLVKDVEPTDQYGRLLRYVYLEDEFVNELLVAGGFAMARSYEPNTRAKETLREAEDAARAGRVGMWSTEGCAVDSSLRIVTVHADALGPDDENLDDEWLEVANEGPVVVDLGGWAIRDAESVHRFTFPAGTLIGPGARLRVVTGCTGEIAWCSGDPVWNNSGDVAFLLDDDGRIADRFEY